MDIKYKSKVEFQSIDIEKLRPKKSYDHLQQNRDGALAEILQNPKLLKTMLKHRKDPLSQTDDEEFLFTKDNLNFVRNKNSDLIYVNPIFDAQKYNEIYQSDEYQEILDKLQLSSHDYRRERFGVERVDFIEKWHKEELPKTYLDIGCSTGFILEEAQSRGWNVNGIELAHNAAEFARQRGINVTETPLEVHEFDHKFSAISMFDVLEHLAKPDEALKIVHELMEDDGMLYIYVPNWDSAARVLLGEENTHFIWGTHHLTYFTPVTLQKFLEAYGFEVVFWETQGLDLVDWMWHMEAREGHDISFLKPHIETLQFFVNAAGHGNNLRMFARKV